MTKYQNFFPLVLIICIGLFVFTSCEKEDMDDYDNQEMVENGNALATNLTNGMQSGGSVDCFEIVFPIELTIPGTGNVTINDYDELETTLDDWYEANPDPDDYPMPVFPVIVILEDGTQQTINDEENLEDLFEDCFGDDWEEDCDEICDDDDEDGDDDDDEECDEDFLEEFCLELVYPVDLSMPDGTTATANDDDELMEIIEAYLDQNPDPDEYPELVFPLDVVLPDGTTQTISDDDEFWDLVEDTCEDDDDYGDFDDCFELNYPVTVVFPDSSTQSVNDDDELEEAIEAFYDANPNTMEEPSFEYPISVTLEDGTEVTVNSDDELWALEENCD